jgi:hypothetical protein
MLLALAQQTTELTAGFVIEKRLLRWPSIIQFFEEGIHIFVTLTT